MKNNPFSSDVFSATWLMHFNPGKAGLKFDIFPDLGFVKHRFLPLCYNIGKTLTKGISYTLLPNNAKEYKNKVFLIYDVPTYFELDPAPVGKLKLIRIKQYPGFLIGLEKYKDFNDYMLTTYSKSSRYKLNKYKKKLEQCFDIEYKMFYGEMSKNEYDEVFDHFKVLLEKRFSDKQITNNNLHPDEWNFYNEVAYPMILEKKASLFVIYDGGKPIGITLNYFSDSVLFDAITVFDIDYAKFHLGSVTVMKLIEWCLEHKLKIFDFSKGEFDYKKRWANKAYDFEYHLYYNSASVTATVMAFGIKSFYSLKQTLRERKLNEVFHRLSFRLRSGSNKKDPGLPYEFSETEQEYKLEDLVQMDCKSPENQFLKNIVFDFLYLNNEVYSDLKIHAINTDNRAFLFSGKTKNVKVTLCKPAI